MSRSEHADQIWAALAVAQGVMKNAPFDSINPHFKSKYASLASVADTVREALSKNGIAVTHTTDIVTYASGEREILVTTFGHKSGQWIESKRLIPAGLKVQEYGAWLTYNRRYAVISLAAISADQDDDVNSVQQVNGKRENPNINKPEDFVDKAQYAEDGTPINNIPFGNSELRKLSKKDAEIEYNNLLVKMKYQTTREAMMVWGKSIADNVQTLPDLYQVQLREEFADRLNELP